MNAPTPSAILNKAQEYLEEIEPFADEMAQELTPQERSTIRTAFATLSTQAERTISESELLQLASDLVSTFEAIPLLRENFVGEINPAAEKEKRDFTLQMFLKGTEDSQPLTKDDEELASIVNILQTRIKYVIDTMLPDEKGSEDSDEKEQTS